uniref:hypothetical protein n=1 Tax=Halomonas sp. TaxID=1486246 RepID=UPI00262DEA1F|nr:hypothetical protein [Halomonas sp.]
MNRTTLLLPHMPSEKHHYPKARIVRRALPFWRRPRAEASHQLHDKVEVGCLAHTYHEVVGPGEMENAKRRLDFYARWNGLKAPHLQIWKIS